MSEQTNAMDALTGAISGGGSSAGEATDWKAKYEEAQRELNSARVEQGRVKKLDEEKKALENQLEELRAARLQDDAMSALPDDLRSDLPADYQKGASIIAHNTVSAELKQRDAEIADLRRKMVEREQRDAAMRNADFARLIESRYPGFLVAISEGGDKCDAWKRYLRFNRNDVVAARNSGDIDAMIYHIDRFFTEELGVQPPSGASEAAAPDPSAISGGQPTAQRTGRQYTEAEIDDLFDKKEAARDRGDWAEVKRLTDEINRAQASGGAKQ